MINDDPDQWHIGLLGYGEVNRILVEDLRAGDLSVGAYDVKLGGPHAGPLVTHASAYAITLEGSHAALAARADCIVSAVTASQAVAAAQACTRAIKSGAFFLDFNSASPGAKIAAAQLIDAAGGRYVEGAVMTTMPPYRIKVPLLLGGPHATALLPKLCALGFA